jgi:hypothetical protein
MSLLHVKRTGLNPPRGAIADWWVLTTANAAGTNGLTWLPKHGGAPDNKFLVTHPMINVGYLENDLAMRNTTEMTGCNRL